MDHAGSELGVLVAIHRRLIPTQKDLPTGSGFAVRPHVVKDDPKDIVNLGVFCTDAACEDIFLHFMRDLVAHLLTAAASEVALRTFLARVGLWQRYFVTGGGEHLSGERQCGLFGEVLLLRDLLIPAVGPSAAVDAWKGPEGCPQDFQTHSCVIEVKCSRAKAGIRISIANELQLDERPFPHLVLVLVAISGGGALNASLVELIAEVRLLLASSGRPLDVFNDQLINAGYVDAHGVFYSENRFFLREIRYFEVRDDFPRIRHGDFHAGVIEITYKLDLAAILPFEVEQAVVEGWLKT